MNLYRTPKWNPETKSWERPLDLKFLRICAVHRLLTKKKIGRARAVELVAQRHTPKEMRVLNGTIGLWNIPGGMLP
jgi:hypothetical protein